jgi:hypothetical protein
MRLHSLEEFVAELDRRVGRRQRGMFLSEAPRRGRDDKTRWDDIETGIAALCDREHEWDADPARWVHEQRTR